MTQMNAGANPPSGPTVLDYRRPESEPRAGYFESIGYFIGVLGGARRLALAFGMAFVLGGLGECIAATATVRHLTPGPIWMGLGGFLIGAMLPLNKAKS